MAIERGIQGGQAQPVAITDVEAGISIPVAISDPITIDGGITVDTLPTPTIPAGAKSGVTAVATPGTAVVLGTGAIGGPLAVKALKANTDLMYVGNVSGDVASTNGFSLSPGDTIVFNYVSNLNQIYVDAAVGGESVCWLALNV